ncbi:MAG: universal stress protein [Natronomonas sp.]
MFDRVLFPTDGGDGADAIRNYVFDLVEAHDAELHVLHVADTTRDSTTIIEGKVVDALERKGRQIVDSVATEAGDRGMDVVTQVLQGRIAETIATYAVDFEIDCIAMATHGRTGLSRVILGSVTERLIERSSVPVLALDPDDVRQFPIRSILVATQVGDARTEVVDAAAELATGVGSELRLLSIGEWQRTPDASDRQPVDGGAGIADSAGVGATVEVVEEDLSRSEAISTLLDDRDDLVVTATPNATGSDRVPSGGSIEEILDAAPVPVLFVSEPENSAS